MRVIGGTARGNKLHAVPGIGTRPILDRVKAALFDILRPGLEGARVLDLFAGSGAVGIEALSQGADSCVFLDLSRAAVKTVKENLARTQLADRAEVRHHDAFSYVRTTTRAFDLIYVAPPQYKGIWVEMMKELGERPRLLAPDGVIVAQIDPKELEEIKLTSFTQTDKRKYGNTLLLFWESSLAKERS